jgi:hypothetical protein
MAVDMERMKIAICFDPVNFPLRLASAVFSTDMCCSVTKAMVRRKLEKRRMRQRNKIAKPFQAIEEGIIRLSL